uniref:Uncharacterized protein n=1 Tax=Utricularia reniformis TaxID=192314 RepID=A0A1Y0AZC4_9LAMI|nr:hypothetical protein AEK19_MT0202 [Utricularia reniformis]ART30481.1 hypothetical protein AEK19_MT0202 [Utricularia reniformis]
MFHHSRDSGKIYWDEGSVEHRQQNHPGLPIVTMTTSLRLPLFITDLQGEEKKLVANKCVSAKDLTKRLYSLLLYIYSIPGIYLCSLCLPSGTSYGAIGYFKLFSSLGFPF